MCLIYILLGILLFIGFTVKFIEDNIFLIGMSIMVGLIIGICQIVAKNDERRAQELKEKTKDP